jgi:hypothetical protein
VEDQLTSPAEGEAHGAVARAGSAPVDSPPDLATGTVPDGLVSEFSSLSTPYCWVITEDPVAGYDGAEPSAVGKAGPPEAGSADIQEALVTGKFFRLTGADGHPVAIGRLYDPSGGNDRAPLDDLAEDARPMTEIEYRTDGAWQAV